jgi:hypothetical protein
VTAILCVLMALLLLEACVLMHLRSEIRKLQRLLAAAYRFRRSAVSKEIASLERGLEERRGE